MIPMTMQILTDRLLDYPAERWTDDDWAVVAAAVCGYRKAGWHDPSDMMPVVQLLDAVWRSWNGIPDTNQILALEILGELVDDLVESARDFIGEMRNGQVLYADAMQQLHAAEWDVDDDDDDYYLPFGDHNGQTSIDDDL